MDAYQDLLRRLWEAARDNHHPLLTEAAQGLESLIRRCQELEKAVVIDELTGLYKLSYFKEQVEAALEQARRGNFSCSLIMLDLDFFKQINDTYGHQTGNMVLQAVARTIARNIRKTDTAARYGGEEFAVLLPATGLEGAVALSRRLKRAIARVRVKDNGQEIKVTASLGISVFKPHQEIGWEEFLRQADEQLLRAKQEGRNRICYPDWRSLYPAEAGVSAEEKGLLFGRKR
ncbi:GGDEF domain-containing protein [Thermosulfuriphilus sp.]